MRTKYKIEEAIELFRKVQKELIENIGIKDFVKLELVTELFLERKRKGISLKELSERTGLKAKRIRNMEQGECVPAFKEIQLLIDAVDMDFDISFNKRLYQ